MIQICIIPFRTCYCSILERLILYNYTHSSFNTSNIAADRLVVLAEVNTVSQDWGYLFFKLSLAEALEEVATSITEEAWLYNEYAFNISFDYIHRFL